MGLGVNCHRLEATPLERGIWGEHRMQRDSLAAQWERLCLQCRRHEFNPWVRKIPWRRKWQPTPVFLPGESHGQRSLAGYSPWGRTWVRLDLATKQQQYRTGTMPGHRQVKYHEEYGSVCALVSERSSVWKGPESPASLLPSLPPLPLAGMPPLHISTSCPSFSFRLTHSAPAQPRLDLVSTHWPLLPGIGGEAQIAHTSHFPFHPILSALQASTQSPRFFICVIVTGILQLINPLVIQVQPCFRSDPHKSWWAEMLVQKKKKKSLRASSF